jgi:hypothetical protein
LLGVGGLTVWYRGAGLLDVDPAGANAP